MGLTQLEVANKAKITVRSYQRIEKGVQDPKTTTSLLIAQALHTTVEEIFPLPQRQLREIEPDGNLVKILQEKNTTKLGEPQQNICSLIR